MSIPPISNTNPVLPGGNVANTAPPGPFFRGHSPPFPTCTWWVGFAAPPNQEAVVAGPFPFMSQCLDNGLAFGVAAKRDFDGVSVHQPAEIDILASFLEHDGQREHHRAQSWDELSVTVIYVTAHRSMISYLVPGAPYMTFKYANATPVLNARRGVYLNVNGHIIPERHPVRFSGLKFRLATEHGLYLVYSLHGPLTFEVTRTALTASEPFNGVLRVARLVQPSQEPSLDAYVRSYPVSAELTYEFHDDIGILVFHWNIVGDEAQFIHLSWPHHRKVLQSPQFLPATALSYLTIKGWMVPVFGTIWRMKYALPIMDFHPPRAPDTSCVAAIVEGLEYEIAALGSPPEPGDFYFYGGAIAAASRLALISEHVDRGDLVPKVVDYLAASLACWTDPTYTRVQAAYETNWGAVISKAGASDPHVDFGNGFMNDHHFHYGYLLAAAAVVARNV